MFLPFQSDENKRHPHLKNTKKTRALGQRFPKDIVIVGFISNCYPVKRPLLLKN